MSEIVSGERRFTSEDVQHRVAQVAVGYTSLGLRPGDGVAMCLRNDVAFFEASVAAAAIGCYPVQINWHYTAGEVRYILEDSEARVLVVHADLLHAIRGSIPNGVRLLVVPTPPEIRAEYGLEDAECTLQPGDVEWDTWRDQHTPKQLDPAGFPMSIIYTSGTTGRPKGVKRPPLTADGLSVFTSMLSRCYGFDGSIDPSTVVTAVIGPTYHSAPNGHATFAFRFGASIVVMPRFDPENLLRLIERERITHLNMVPIMFTRLLKLPADIRNRYDLSSLRFVAHAAAPCPPEVKREMIDWWGPIIYEYYGSTEIGNVTFCSSEEWLAHPGTVGRVIPEAVVQILDDSLNPLPANSIGEVAGTVRGLGDFAYNNDEEKRVGVDRDGLVAPGDVGYFDYDGFLFICDRKVDMIISGGVNIYPATVEAALHEMDAIADCAVFGIPDNEYGESVYAVIEPAPDHQGLTADDVKSFLRERLAGYMIPRRIEFAQNLPREDSGKIFKRKLRAPHWEDAGRSI